MHPIAKHFSADARRVVVEKFSGDNVTPNCLGALVEYHGVMCCALGLALLVDVRTTPSKVLACRETKFTPYGEEISNLLGRTVDRESKDFINTCSLDPKKIVAAFS